MADVAVRSSTEAFSSSANTIDLAEPANAAVGDLIVCAVMGNGENAWSDGNGATPYTQDWELINTHSGSVASIFSRVKVSGDPTTLTFDLDSTERLGAIAVCFQDIHTTPYDIAPSVDTEQRNFTNTDNLNCDGITTVIDKSLHIIMLAVDRASVVIDVPTGYTEIQLLDNTAGQQVGFCYKIITPAGDTGVINYTITGTDSAMMTQSFSIANNSGGAAATPHGPFGLAFHGPFGGPI